MAQSKNKTGLRHVGDVVRVKSASEIARTLNDDGTLDGLPFMPEMLRFSGGSFVVRRLAHKTCDTITFTGMRRMDDAIHLDGPRCDGSSHGGCETGCLLFWKEAWLEPVESPENGPPEMDAPRSVDIASPLADRFTRSARLHGRSAESDSYSCQATELLNATSPLPWWHPGQYVRDVRSGNVALGAVLRDIIVLAFNKLQAFTARFLPRALRIRGGRRYPLLAGPHRRTPLIRLGLEPGQHVKVRSRKEITGSLDADGRNRGLAFDADMLQYCGRSARVTRRVKKIIEESTGRLKTIHSDCLVLDDIACSGRYHRLCPRGSYFFWREAWLHTTDGSSSDSQIATG